MKRVLLLLKMEVSDDTSAAIITAIISPRRPVGQRRLLGPARPAPRTPSPSCLRPPV